MNDTPKPWIILYDLKQSFEDSNPIKKVFWHFGTKKETLEYFSKGLGAFVVIKYLIPCDHFFELIGVNKEREEGEE